MNRSHILFICLFFSIQISLSALSADPKIAITNVNIIPMDTERVIEDQTVIIENGIIKEIGAANRVNLPDNSLQIDGSGKYLIPGLAEMHAHIPPIPASPSDDWDEEYFNQWVENVLFLYVAAGVTTVRGMLGHPMHLELRERVENGELIGPRIWTSGPSVNGNTVRTVERAREIPAEQKAAGYDFIKIHPGLQRDVYEALYEAAQEADFWYAGHVPAEVGVHRALETGYLSIDHLDGYIEILIPDDVDGLPAGQFFGFNLTDYVDENKIYEAARRTKEAGVWIVPTQILFETILGGKSSEELASWPEMKYVPRNMLENWKQRTRNMHNSPNYTPERAERFISIRRKLIKALHDINAGIILGADAPQWWNVPGFAIYRELRTYVASGLTPYEALKTGTVNVATFFETTEFAGTLEEGKWADMVLLTANPLNNIDTLENVEGVIVRGVWISKSDIHAGLENIAEMYAE
jgi:imidazolonepropionase-like amidohydrolase